MLLLLCSVLLMALSLLTRPLTSATLLLLRPLRL
jgi:hypothetical protein